MCAILRNENFYKIDGGKYVKDWFPCKNEW